MGKRRRHIKPNFKDRGEIETATPAKEDLHRPSGGNRSVPGPGVVCDIDKVTEVQDVYQDSNGGKSDRCRLHDLVFMKLYLLAFCICCIVCCFVLRLFVVLVTIVSSHNLSSPHPSAMP